MDHLDRIRHLGKTWKTLTDQQKEKYGKLAAEEKVRYAKETKELESNGFFVNSEGIKSTDIKPELKQFPAETTVFPKKCLSTWFHFNTANAKILREANPGWGVGQIGPESKKTWDTMSDAAKKPYEQLQVDDRIRFDKEVDQLRTYGYFINSEGQRSNELEKKFTKGERKVAREKAAVEKEKSQAQDEKEKAKLNAIDPEDETKGWTLYYQTFFDKVLNEAEGKSAAAKKKTADRTLQNNWVEFTEKQKKLYVAKAKRADDQSSQNSSPKKRQQPSDSAKTSNKQKKK
jgi:hypothetical protein